MPNYATAGDVLDFKVNGRLIDLGAYTTLDIEEDLDLAEELINSITGDRFSAITETNLFDGNGLTKLFFPPGIPYRNLTVSSVQEFDLDGTTVLDTFVEDQDFKRYPFYIETARAFDTDTARRRFGSGGIWPKGQENISIAGTWGMATTPIAIKRATILLALERMRPGSTKLQSGEVSSVTWPDFSMSLSAAGESITGQSTGYNYIDRLLHQHINWSSAFFVVPDERTLHG